MERKIGEIFIYKDKTYQAVEVEIDEECKGCAFEFSSCCTSLLGDCSPTHRTDGASVIFKEINNMENNQLTIDIPEGMEIDLENSNLAKGIVKFKKKYITYDDILQAYATDFGGLRVPNHCIDRILAISQLMNIAKYYNEDWEPDWNNQDEYKYFIICNRGTYKVDHGWTSICSNIYFKNKKDAQAVIDNPNFRDILDAVYKN
jgi:hypothetical protein